jgi:hypothetical protein
LCILTFLFPSSFFEEVFIFPLRVLYFILELMPK